MAARDSGASQVPEGVTYDVAVIGAGISGLTAAALLARAGLGVCVLEEQPHPGGYLQACRRGGLTFDPASQWLHAVGPGGRTGRACSGAPARQTGASAPCSHRGTVSTARRLPRA